MIIAIIGENCSGKSTLAKSIQAELGAEVITGKDYLRLAKTESEATALFKEKLKNAEKGENIIYVISEKEQIDMLPESALRILVFADIQTIKERFKKRMHGVLPPPVEEMLERKHGMFESGEYDYRFNGVDGDTNELCRLIKESGEGKR